MAALPTPRTFVRYRSFGRVALACAFIAGVSCDLVKPKDRKLNADAKPPTISPIDPSVLKPGQHVAGVIHFEMGSSIAGLSSPVGRVEYYLDDSLVTTQYSPPYPASIDTRPGPQGAHTLAAAVFETHPNLGLIGAVGAPSVVVHASVVFDQTPPTAVTLSSATLDGDIAVLDWTANADLNFYAYVIERQTNYGDNLLPPGLIGQGPEITDQAQLSFRDSTFRPLVIGASALYHVHVANRAESAPSNGVKITYGDYVPGLAPDINISQRVPRPVQSTVADEFYVYLRDTLRAYSTVSHSMIRQLEVRTKNFTLSGDGTKVYGIFHDYAFQTDYLVTYDALSFAQIGSQLAMTTSLGNNDYAIVAGRPDRLYITNTSRLVVVDAGTGATAGQLDWPFSTTMLAISPDKNTLYAATLDSVYRIDVTTDAATIVDRRGITFDVADMQLSSDGLRLYLGHVWAAPSNFVEILDAGTFANVGSVSTASGQELYSFAVTANYLYVSESRTDPRERYYKPGKIVQYGRTTLAPSRSWDLVIVSQWMSSSRNEQTLYAEGPEVWVIPALSLGPQRAAR